MRKRKRTFFRFTTLLLPVVEAAPPFYFGFGSLGKECKEVDVCYSFHLIHAVDVVAHGPVAIGIAVYKAYGCRVWRRAEHYLEEGFGHRNAVANMAVRASVEYRAAHNV